MVAAHQGNNDIVQILLAAGANIEAATSKGKFDSSLPVTVDDNLLSLYYINTYFSERLDIRDYSCAPGKSRSSRHIITLWS
jgi:ankyrin repeat protein